LSDAVAGKRGANDIFRPRKTRENMNRLTQLLEDSTLDLAGYDSRPQLLDSLSLRGLVVPECRVSLCSCGKRNYSRTVLESMIVMCSVSLRYCANIRASPPEPAIAILIMVISFLVVAICALALDIHLLYHVRGFPLVPFIKGTPQGNILPWENQSK
jgi:hypothetical protein